MTIRCGWAHAIEIIRAYSAEKAVFQHKAILINVYRSVQNRPLLGATRFAWKISATKAEKADVILATAKGIIVGAFIAIRWRKATRENFPEFGMESASRLAFEGKDATEEMQIRFATPGATNQPNNG